MNVKVVKEIKIAVLNSHEEYQIVMILDALGVRYTFEERLDGVKVIRVDLKEM